MDSIFPNKRIFKLYLRTCSYQTENVLEEKDESALGLATLIKHESYTISILLICDSYLYLIPYFNHIIINKQLMEFMIRIYYVLE